DGARHQQADAASAEAAGAVVRPDARDRRVAGGAGRGIGGDMTVRVQLFAVARQWADADAVELDLPSGATVGELRVALVEKLPRLEQFGPLLRFAVNSEYADDRMNIPK